MRRMAARSRSYCIDATPLSDRMLECVPQAITDESKGIEEVALSRAVRADEGDQTSEADVAGLDASVVAQGNPSNENGHRAGHSRVEEHDPESRSASRARSGSTRAIARRSATRPASSGMLATRGPPFNGARCASASPREAGASRSS